jgi:uncharacterized protein
MASLILDEIEARVLGCLIEKDLTTPDYYPLSLNALVNACNQKSNREPATNHDEQTVLDAIDRLRHKGLATVTTGSEHRVPKYGHRAYETLDLGRREIAVLTPMLLRGAQTLNELKVRTERMYSFDDTDAVLSAIHKLASHEGGPFAVELPRQTGMRETRYTHLFFGEPAMPPAVHEPAGVHAPREDRLARLEAEVEALKAQFAEFRKQFE